ncbi:PREDICTED: complement factor H [Pseudopodoces humilis]|uniref:complement factor H n=1 Tax=Pseudopodoces humilis TaxID=181119 RepID=UPI0006B75C01|nr:PREDICTED: complement factor H [Pseudopodoces humilis]
MLFLGYTALLLCWMHCAAERACEDPPPRRVKEVPTKRWDKPPYPHGTQATYTCRPGYVKIGRVAFQCIDGAWKQLAPVTECRNKPCGHPGDTEFGFFELTSGSEFVFGARVEYRCNDGYQMLSQRNYRECRADGWSNDIPHCEVIKCLPVQEPENGRIIMTGAFELGQEYSFGQVVNFECNAKHKLVGAEEIVCSANGKWSNDVPQCKEINCDVPEIPHGYVRSSKKSYKENELMQFFCEEGYKYGNRADALCTESGWNPPPYCTEIVCSPPVISFGNFRPQKDKYTLGNTITVECDAGYHFKVTTGRTTAECTKNGWVPDPACVRKPCDYPPIENGRLSDSYEYHRRYYFPKRFGQTVDYYCLDGYSTPTGTVWVRITCSERGWFPEPKCLKKCSIRGLENGYFPHHGWDDFYKEGERVRYGCYSDYQAQHEEVTCTRNGWAPPPRCIRKKKCQGIIFENGYLNSGRTTFRLKDKISYKCHAGFVTPEGEEIGHIQCQDSGWTPPPKCIKSCKAPGDILIHHTNKTVFMPEDTIEYSCLEGYKTTNNMPTDTTMCGKNGEWSPAPQCHEIKCVLLPLSNGDFSPKESKYHSGAVVKFTCVKNYIRVGPASIQCYHFGWFPSPPVCQVSVRGCGPPPEITNGSIVDGSVEQYQHGDRKQYECNGEFKLVGSKEIECIDGQWSSPPSCTEDKMPCESPSSIPNVVLHQADQTEYSHGDEVTCGCKPGSDNTEEMKIKCLNGEWKPLPVCADASPQCIIPEDVELVRSGQYPMSRRKTGFHKVIRYTCSLTDENVKEAACVSGRWTPEIACTAEESVCPPPPQVSGTQQTTVGRSYRNGSKAAFSCPDGFHLVGTKEITCTEGKWQSPPHCVERPCLPPQSVECADAPRQENPNLKIEREGKTIYLAGARFKYVSRPGYKLDGPTETNCSMGKWTAAPSCLEMPCGSVPKVANAQFEGREKKFYEPGETIRYQCDSGFLIVGSPEIICRKGNWTAPPFCEDVSCGAAPEIPNAHIASTPQERYLPGARVHYQCESNFQMTGGNYILCSNGQWSQAPVCRDVTCEPPPEIAGGRIDGIKKSRYIPGESAKYQCWKNFKMTGASSVVCQNGTWTQLPTCKGRAGRCGTPPAIQSGELLVFPLQEYQQGDTVEYKCPNFYILKGSPTITCLNGQWTSPPVCLVACTASEEDMDRNNIELKWVLQTKLYSTSGDYIEFRCKPGYVEDPSTSSFRVQCVEGTLEYPRCTLGRNCALDRNTMEKNNIQLQSSSQLSHYYHSGDSVVFECKRGYRQVSQMEKFRAQCLDGVITYPECEESSWFG